MPHGTLNGSVPQAGKISFCISIILCSPASTESNCPCSTEGSHTYQPTLDATTKHKQMKNPWPTSCPDRVSAFLQTALSDLLRAGPLYSRTPDRAEQLR